MGDVVGALNGESTHVVQCMIVRTSNALVWTATDSMAMHVQCMFVRTSNALVWTATNSMHVCGAVHDCMYAAIASWGVHSYIVFITPCAFQILQKGGCFLAFKAGPCGSK